MALARSRRPQRTIDYWPGFVDALSTMLLVITFLLSVFMLSQFFMSRDVSSKDTVLSRLNRQIEELTSLLALERAGKSDTQSTLASLQSTLDAADKEKVTLEAQLQDNASTAASANLQVDETGRKLDAQTDVTGRAWPASTSSISRSRPCANNSRPSNRRSTLRKRGTRTRRSRSPTSGPA